MTKLIAEIGWNHMGDMDLAESMIHAAASSGASIAKFQTWSVSRLKDGAWDSDGRKEIYQNAELSPERHEYLISACSNHGVDFMSSAFSLEDAKLLKSLNVKTVKIPSFEVANSKLLSYCDSVFDELIVSTGTATKDEIEAIGNFVDINKTTVMHCVSSYPCNVQNANLPRLAHLSSLYPSIGYSDHVQGISASIYALSFNLTYIEKHFTTDHNLPGRDNKFAILPAEMMSLSNHLNDYAFAYQDLGVDYQGCESDSRSHYRGRFSKI